MEMHLIVCIYFGQIFKRFASYCDGNQASLLQNQQLHKLFLENTGSPGGESSLPVVPQVHCTLLDFAEDFKAALQLSAGAVRPQSPHVHDPSLLLLVKGRHRQRGGGD